MKTIVFLRIILVCALVFLLYVAINKLGAPKPATVASAPPQQTNIEPPKQTKETPARRAVPSQTTPQQTPVEIKTPPVAAETTPITVEQQKPTIRLTPTDPSSGLPDTLSFTILECHRAGEWVKCSGVAKTTAEIAQKIYLEDSSASDDQGRAFDVYLSNGFSFDRGWNEKLLPGMPLKFNVPVSDPYPSSKTLNLRLHIFYYAIDRENYYHEMRELVYRDIPIQ